MLDDFTGTTELNGVGRSRRLRKAGVWTVDELSVDEESLPFP
jgi:hypothetical protein